MSYKHAQALQLWPIENAHMLYSKMATAHLAMPTATPTARGLYNNDSLPSESPPTAEAVVHLPSMLQNMQQHQ